MNVEEKLKEMMFLTERYVDAVVSLDLPASVVVGNLEAVKFSLQHTAVEQGKFRHFQEALR